MTKTKADGLTEVLKVRLTPAGLEELDAIATAEGVNRSEALRRVLEWVVAEHKAGKIGKVDSATGTVVIIQDNGECITIDEELARR